MYRYLCRFATIQKSIRCFFKTKGKTKEGEVILENNQYVFKVDDISTKVTDIMSSYCVKNTVSQEYEKVIGHYSIDDKFLSIHL